MFANRLILGFMAIWWTVTLLSLPSPSDLSETGLIIVEWYKAFSLPLWSIILTGIWHDIGRNIWHKWITLDNNHHSSMLIEWIVFVLWMTLVFTFIIYTHVILGCFILLFLIPLFAVLLKDWLIMSWNDAPAATSAQLVLVLSWAVGGFTVHFLLSSLWNDFLIYLSNTF